MAGQDNLEEESGGEEMRMAMTQKRDPVAWVGICFTVLINIASLAWLAGRFDQRMATAEASISKLEVKSEKDSAQDVQIAVISTQLSTITTGVAEIKTKLDSKK